MTTKAFFFLILSTSLSQVEASVPSKLGQKGRTLYLEAEALFLQKEKSDSQKLAQKILQDSKKFGRPSSPPLAFDLPVTYNSEVRHWIRFFQTKGRKNFNIWLQRAHRYFPVIKKKLIQHNMPQDLAYLAMIESGLSSLAKSHANAVGPWQFIRTTANRFGLRTQWWLDERRNLEKSTLAAISYLKILHEEFGSWYLVFASYNMGENGVRRRIKKHKTTDYWKLVRRKAIPKETQEYVPKLIATMLIAKAPGLYGFRDVRPLSPLQFDEVRIPGGTNINSLADHLGVSRKYFRYLNAELVKGFVPKKVKSHKIKIPRGARRMVSLYLSQKKRY